MNDINSFNADDYLADFPQSIDEQGVFDEVIGLLIFVVLPATVFLFLAGAVSFMLARYWGWV